MARTELTVHEITSAGLANPSGTVGIADGHKFDNSASTFIEVDNGSGSSRVLTIQTAATVSGRAIADDTVTIPGSATRYKAGPFTPLPLFNRPAGDSDAGMVYIDYPSGQHADFTVRVFAT